MRVLLRGGVLSCTGPMHHLHQPANYATLCLRFRHIVTSSDPITCLQQQTPHFVPRFAPVVGAVDSEARKGRGRCTPSPEQDRTAGTGADILSQIAREQVHSSD